VLFLRRCPHYDKTPCFTVTPCWLTHAGNPLLWMVLVALALRVALVLYLRSYDFPMDAFNTVHTPEVIRHFPFSFGKETGAVAYSLATGRGFSSPFATSTGPTTWLAPLYPAMCALVFKIFGCFTLASGFVMLLINSLFAALTCIPLCRIGELTVSRKVGLWSGWVWAAGVFFMRWPTTWVWEVSLSAFLLSVMFLQSLRLGNDPGWMGWVRFGLLWAIAALTNPALLAFLPAAGLYPTYRLWRSRRPWCRPAAISAFVFVVSISPWIIRNRVTFGEWIFIRGNAPFEFALGNYHGSTGLGWFGRHPSQNKLELAKYERMGEVAYVTEKKHDSLMFVKQYPMEFLQLCATRFAAFWIGSPLTTESSWRYWFYAPISAFTLLGLIVALAYRIEGAVLFFWLMFSYPVVYYLTFAQPRYRHAIEPEMLLLTTYFVSLAIRDLTVRFSTVRQSRSPEMRPLTVTCSAAPQD
jgi:4-amino-4-deoxy-L-arabinose transferase-like glycosyltransferase